MNDLDELIEPEHVVPTHLSMPDRVGWLTVRQLNALLGPTLLASPAGWLLGDQFGLPTAVAGALVPMLVGGALALPVQPPVEHGLRKLVDYRLSAKTIGPARMPAYTRMKEAGSDGVVRHTWKQECSAVWRLPTTNLRLAHTLQKQAAVTRWARFLDGLACPVQIVVRATPVHLAVLVDRIATRAVPTQSLAGFLRAHAIGSGLVQRERYLVVGAGDPDQLADRVRSIEESLSRAGLPPHRVQDEPRHGRILHDLLQACWSPRAGSHKTLGPSVLRIEPQLVNTDGQSCRTMVLSAWPRAVHTDWLAPLLDGGVPIDVAMHIEPQDSERMCARLDTRLRQYHSSPPSAARDTAIEDAERLRRALERRREHAFSVGVYFLVRASTTNELDERTKRVRQIVRELGGNTQVPRCEHAAGLASCVPAGGDRLRRRIVLDTSTLARTYPASSSMLVLEGGVPWGVTAQTPVVFTPFHRSLKNPHMAFYATSGAGKGYAAKVLQARLAQGKSVRVFGIDQDEDEEYTRLAEYLEGQVIRFGLPDGTGSWPELAAVDLGGTCTIFNLAQVPEQHRAELFRQIKHMVWSWVQEHGGPASFIVDEAITLLRYEQAANELEDLVRRGRHIQLGGVFITQRVADFFNTTCGQVIQAIASSQWYGQQLPTELARVADVLRLSPAEREFLQQAGIGEGLLVAMGQRVAMSLWGHTSPEEYAMGNTDPQARSASRKGQSHAVAS
jgi:hypothetical protein